MTTTKQTLKPVSKIQSVSEVLGEPLFEYLAEALDLHEELKSLIKKHDSLLKKREEVFELAPTYFLKSDILPHEQSRNYTIAGLESDILQVESRMQQIKRIFSFMLKNPN